MLRHEFDQESGSHYFAALPELPGDGGLVWRTEELGGRTVNIDYDPYGNVIGVEVI